MIFELAVFRLFFYYNSILYTNLQKILNTYLLRMHREVSTSSPGSATSQCFTWITWKFDRPMYQLVYLEV